MSKTKHLLNSILSLTEVAGKVGVPRPDLSMTLDEFIERFGPVGIGFAMLEEARPSAFSSTNTLAKDSVFLLNAIKYLRSEMEGKPGKIADYCELVLDRYLTLERIVPTDFDFGKIESLHDETVDKYVARNAFLTEAIQFLRDEMREKRTDVTEYCDTVLDRDRTDDFAVPKDFTFEKSLVRGVYRLEDDTPEGAEIKIQYDTVSTTIEVFDDEKCVYVELENLEYTE